MSSVSQIDITAMRWRTTTETGDNDRNQRSGEGDKDRQRRRASWERQLRPSSAERLEGVRTAPGRGKSLRLASCSPRHRSRLSWNNPPTRPTNSKNHNSVNYYSTICNDDRNTSRARTRCSPVAPARNYLAIKLVVFADMD